MLRILILLLLPINLLAQFHIKGIVVDSIDKNPLPYTSVYIQGTNVGTITNSEGFFEFALKTELLELEFTFSYLGYQKEKVVIKNQSDVVEIRLSKSTDYIDEVEVKGFSADFISEIIYKTRVNLIKERQKSIQAKSFAKIFSRKNDTLNVELLEAFYTSKLNKFEIAGNTFKNGRVKFENDYGIRIYSLDIFYTFIHNINFLFPEDKLLYKREYQSQHSSSKPLMTSVVFENPFILTKQKSIKKLFHLSAEKIDEDLLKITYVSKENAEYNGSYIVDYKNYKVKELMLKTYYRKVVPLRFVDEPYDIDSLSLDYTISYDEGKYPKLFKLDLEYFYTDSMEVVNKIQSDAEQFVYQYKQSFQKPHYNIPYNFNKNDYNLASITPINDSLWKYEPKIAKSVIEDDFDQSNSLLIDFREDINIEKWRPYWVVDISRLNMVTTDLYVANIETIIYYDVYTIDGNIYVETEAFFDYNKTKFNFKPNTKLIKQVFELTKEYADILKKRLEEEKDLSNHKHIYENTIWEFNRQKKIIINYSY